MQNPDWTQLSDQELLTLRIKDLGLKLEHSDIYPRIQKGLEELQHKGLQLQPRIYLGDEWFSPEGVTAVAIPFFLAHPRLRELERRMMLECEGETEDYFSKLFRHELGHAFDHAFRISRRKSWQQIFGSAKKAYNPDTYRPRPYSRSYVNNISQWYAQSHPEEDFAETFAVWLDPKSNWRDRYKKWRALKKLEYVDRLAKEFQDKAVSPPKGKMLSEARFLSSTLERYYSRKQKQHAEEYPDFYDKDLLRIFKKASSEDLHSERAARFMRRNRKKIVETLAHWTGERKVTINELLSRIIDRAKRLDLILRKEEAQTSMELVGFLATLVSNYLFTGHFRRNI